MHLLNKVFKNKTRYLKVDGDEFFISEPLQFIKRPEIVVASLYAAFAMAVSQGADNQQKMAITFAPALLVASLANYSERRALRERFKSKDNNKAIDMQPGKNGFITDPADYSAAKENLKQAKLFTLVLGGVTALHIAKLPMEAADQISIFSATFNVTAASLAGYQANKMYVMNKVVKGDWVIVKAPPPLEIRLVYP